MVAPTIEAPMVEFDDIPTTADPLTADERLMLMMYRRKQVDILGETVLDPMDMPPTFRGLDIDRREFWEIMDEHNPESGAIPLAHELLAFGILNGLVERLYIPRRHLFDVQGGNEQRLLDDMRQIVIDVVTGKSGHRIYVEQLVFLQNGKPESANADDETSEDE